MSDVVTALRQARSILQEGPMTPAHKEACARVVREIDAALLRLGDGGPPQRELIAIVCHDLKDPLASIVMGAGFLKRTIPEGESTAAARRVVDAIQRSGERMNVVIGDFHDLAKLEAGTLTVETRPHDAAAVARAAADLFAARATDKSIALDVRAPERPVMVICDRNRTVQALGKLLDNAIKLTQKNGSVTVTVEAEGDRARFVVSDTGRGVPEERRATVFDREVNQRQTPRDGPGLGLAIARGLVELQGGEIGVESRTPPGATFWFALPSAK